MIDVAEGLPQGKALDMMHMRSVERFGPSVIGTNDYADTTGSDVVVVTAGLPRKPGMTRDDLLAANKAIVESVIGRVVAASPDAIIVCVTNPLDVMTYLAKNVSGLPTSRVFGMGGVLDSARFAYAIAEKTGAAISDIDALAIGAHGDAMVPMPRFSTVKRPVAYRPVAGVRGGRACQAHDLRRRRGGRASQDRLGVLRAGGERGGDGARHSRRHRRDAADVRLPVRRVRHLRRLRERARTTWPCRRARRRRAAAQRARTRCAAGLSRDCRRSGRLARARGDRPC